MGNLKLTYENRFVRHWHSIVHAPLPFPLRSNRNFRRRRPPNWPLDSSPFSASVGMPRECVSGPSTGWGRGLGCSAFRQGPRPLRLRHRPLPLPPAEEWRHLAVTFHRCSPSDFANSPCCCGRAAKEVYKNQLKNFSISRIVCFGFSTIFSLYNFTRFTLWMRGGFVKWVAQFQKAEKFTI